MSFRPTERLVRLALCIVAVLLLASLAACTGAPAPQPPQPAARTSAPSPRPADTDTPAPPTAAPASAATVTVQAPPAADDSWARVLGRGELIVGTSADYPPFESLVKYVPQGFDVALLQELGQRLGVGVRFINYAFDGLDNVLELKSSDAVAAALSVTPERLTYADFSDIYYIGQEAILARTGSPIASLTSMADVSRYRIGAQKASSYEAWIRQNLVETGKLPAANLATYMLVSDAVDDLKAGRIDLLVLDAPAAEKIVKDGGVKVVGQGLTQQQYAIAVPRGAVALRTKLNEALAAARADGTLDRLTQEYLKEDAAALPPPGTQVPVASATAPACVDNLVLLAHLNYDPRGNVDFDPGDRLLKSWSVRNTGTCTWDDGYTLVFATGNEPASAMDGSPHALKGPVKPGEEVEIDLDLTAPQAPGDYVALWQLTDRTGEAFGELLPVGVRVVGATPAP